MIIIIFNFSVFISHFEQDWLSDYIKKNRNKHKVNDLAKIKRDLEFIVNTSAVCCYVNF